MTKQVDSLQSYYVENCGTQKIRNAAKEEIYDYTIYGNTGKNLIHCDYRSANDTMYIECFGNTVVLNGACTSNIGVDFRKESKTFIEKGVYTFTYYYVSGELTEAPQGLYMGIRVKDNNWMPKSTALTLTASNYKTRQSKVLNITSDCWVSFGFVGYGTANNLTFNYQLEKGAVSTLFEEYQTLGTKKYTDILVYPYEETTKTVNGVTFTDNGDGTVTANGTATDYCSFIFGSSATGSQHSLILEAGTYKVSGCPIVGSDSTYRLRLSGNNTQKEYGYGRVFTLTETTRSGLVIEVYKDTVLDNVIFTPKVEQITYDIPIETRGKNLIPYPYEETTKTVKGVTFTDNGDGSITVNGTNTSTGQIEFLLRNYNQALKLNLTNSIYYLSGCPQGGKTLTQNYRIKLSYRKDNAYVNGFVDWGEGTKVDLRAKDFDQVYLSIIIHPGVTLDNVRFYPSLEKYEEKASKNEGENLIPYPYEETTKTINGITFTDNGDRTITVNGTATADAVFKMSMFTVKQGQTYYLTGCPSGGSKTTYYFWLRGFDFDIGNQKGVRINCSYDFTNNFEIVIKKDTTVQNLVFKPKFEMGESATPFEYENSGSVISKNLLSYPYRDTTKTTSGVTFTDNKDGSITVTGTPTDAATFSLCGGVISVVGGQTYTLSTNAQNASNIDFRLALLKADGSILDTKITDLSVYTLTLPIEVAKVAIYMSRTATGEECTGTFQPQFELGSEASDYIIYRERKSSTDLLTYPYEDVSKVTNGIQFVDKGNGNIALTGTATNLAMFRLKTFTTTEINKRGKYIISSNLSVAPSADYSILWQYRKDNKYIGEGNTFANSKVYLDLSTVTYDFDEIVFYVMVKKDAYCNKVLLKPTMELNEIAMDYEIYQGKNILNPEGFVKAPNHSAWIQTIDTEDNLLSMNFVDKDSSIDMSGINIGFTYDAANINTAYTWLIENGVLSSKRTSLSTTGTSNKRCGTVMIYPYTSETIDKVFKRYNIQVERYCNSKGQFVSYSPFVADTEITINTTKEIDKTQMLNALSDNLPSLKLSHVEEGKTHYIDIKSTVEPISTNFGYYKYGKTEVIKDKRYDLLPTYHYVDNTDGILTNVADSRVKDYILRGTRGTNWFNYKKITELYFSNATETSYVDYIATATGNEGLGHDAWSAGEIVIKFPSIVESNGKALIVSFNATLLEQGKYDAQIAIWTNRDESEGAPVADWYHIATLTLNEEKRVSVRFIPNIDLTELRIRLNNNKVKMDISSIQIEEDVGYNNYIAYPKGFTYTNNGITFTPNEDNTITVNGTATADMKFPLFVRNKTKNETSWIVDKEDYVLTGCPAGGSTDTYSLWFVTNFTDGSTVENVLTDNISKNIKLKISDKKLNYNYLYIMIKKGTVCDNLVFSPKLTKTSYTPTELHPYIALGDKTENLLMYPYKDTTKTVNGVTFVDNKDGSITVSGKPTATVTFYLADKVPIDETLMDKNITCFLRTDFKPYNNTKLKVQYYDANKVLLDTMSGDWTAINNQGVFRYNKYPENTKYYSLYITNVSLNLNMEGTFFPCVYASNTDSDIQNMGKLKMPVGVGGVNENLLNYNLQTQTNSGVTFTIQTDNSIIVNGTAEAEIEYPIITEASQFTLDKNYYSILGCPNGGNVETYCMGLNLFKNTDKVYTIYDEGHGATFDGNIIDYTNVSISIIIKKGTICDNLVFSPLLYIANQYVVPIRISGKNLFAYPIYYRQLYVSTDSKPLVTFNEEGFVVNGTVETAGNLWLSSEFWNADLNFDETYVFSGGYSKDKWKIGTDNLSRTFNLGLYSLYGGGTNNGVEVNDSLGIGGQNVILTERDFGQHYKGRTYCGIALRFKVGEVFDNCVFKPQIEKGVLSNNLLRKTFDQKMNWQNNKYSTSGLTITDNYDGSVTINGTATATVQFLFNADSEVNRTFLSPGVYYLGIEEDLQGGSMALSAASTYTWNLSCKLAQVAEDGTVVTNEDGSTKIIAGLISTGMDNKFVAAQEGIFVNQVFLTIYKGTTFKSVKFTPYLKGIFSTEFEKPQKPKMTYLMLKEPLGKNETISYLNNSLSLINLNIGEKIYADNNTCLSSKEDNMQYYTY